ncbi:uncharacterized protein LOC103938036 [Pyrus x bretschneideri]|uniref:uncharacterized protein LOC103938036 n=1 Tax=Pyrus x bretschneideri TaxID=225117 RepID=UPI0020303B51|nr:uncharacterized protein LOC103938036 [Pyrus x bretschneideri]
MRGRPLVPGKYGGLRRKRKIRGRRNRSGVMDCKGCKDCRRESILCGIEFEWPQPRLADGSAQLGTGSGIGLSGFGGAGGASKAVSPSLEYRYLDCRLTSQLVKSNGRRLFVVDTLALRQPTSHSLRALGLAIPAGPVARAWPVPRASIRWTLSPGLFGPVPSPVHRVIHHGGTALRRLEGQGVPSKHAEAITSAITEVLNDSLENVSHSFVTKGEMQKTEMIQESNLSKFKSEIQSAQGHHFSLLQHETEKLRNDIEKMRSELRYEIDKVTAGQRLDLNLERGRIREELSNQNAETNNLTNKLDEILLITSWLDSLFGGEILLITYLIRV